jgi:hypothetical protein
MKQIVFLLEEPSARDLLEGLLPKLLPDTVHVRFLVFEGKQDLEKQLVRKIRGWKAPNSSFVVMRDQDAADCRNVRKVLENLGNQCVGAQVHVRVVCRELESWVVGDWQAIAAAFEKPELVSQAQKAIHRMPDKLGRPIDAIRKFIPEYQKRDGARRVGPWLDPSRNQSESFQAFCRCMRRIVTEMT